MIIGFACVPRRSLGTISELRLFSRNHIGQLITVVPREAYIVAKQTERGWIPTRPLRLATERDRAARTKRACRLYFAVHPSANDPSLPFDDRICCDAQCVQ